MLSAAELFNELVPEFVARPGVDFGRMFSSEGLRIRNKVFAFPSHDDMLIVKVSEQRVGELIAAGDAAPMIMRGREMREWVKLPVSAGLPAWRALVTEAHDFVDSITP